MNNREFATFILIGLFLCALLAKRDLRSSLVQILKLLLSPKLGVPLLVFLGWTALAVWLVRRIGFWTSDLTANTALWFLFVGLAWFMNINEAGKDDDFFKKRVIEAVGIGALFEFFINLEVMPLPLELLLQIFVIFVVMLDVVARHKGEYKAVAKLTTGTLALLGLGLTVFTIVRIISDWSTLDLHALVNELLLPVWLTIAAIPCIYFIVIYTGYESLLVQMRFWNDSRRPSAWAILGVTTALKGSPIDINGFRGLYAKQAARTRSFGEARRAVRDFRDDRAADRASKADARQRLITYAGVNGVDSDGLTLDRREFAETKQALRWLATCHMGWYQREDRPNRYRPDLLAVLDDFSRQGLPGDHAITMKVRKDGQAWYAYRKTPSGRVFGIGADGAPPSQWFYDGTKAPQSYPAAGPGWSSFMESDRPEWSEEPETE